MENILETIVAAKHIEIEEQKQALPIEQLRLLAEKATTKPSMAKALQQSGTGIIAEFKRKSPSLGWFRRDARPLDVVPAYQRAGAAACSVLTDYKFFGGHPEFLEQLSQTVSLPLLRKDFIIDEYQIMHARALGASAILLIAACLERSQCTDLAAAAQSMGLDVLLEVHNEDELSHFCPGVTMIGVNNRNLKTFQTNVATSERLASLLPDDAVKVSESGLSSPETVQHLRSLGYRGFLMGEHFMRAERPGDELAKFIAQLTTN